uniref:Ribosomal protein L14 n=1 Tax=Telonemida sp. TaxID=2652706 RepID=A0A5P8DJY0_9EUKA|nr:ribosomal protein L14 [Telonemida sp.]
MIQLNSNLNVVDNSGAKIARCIKVLTNKSYASIGDTVIVSIRKALPNKKVKVGEVHKAIVVYTKKQTKRLNGSYLNFRKNAIVLLNDKDVPQATRVLGGAPRELSYGKFHKILSIAKKPI